MKNSEMVVTERTGDAVIDLSVVSLTWNSMRYLDRMVESVLADADHCDISLELIVIDNGSADGTTERLLNLSASEPRLRVIPLGRNTGTTFSRNIGLRLATGDNILVLDSDTQIPEGTLRQLINATSSIASDQIGLIAPMLTYPDGEFQENVRRFPTLKTKMLRLFGSNAARAEDESIPEVLNKQSTAADYAISAAWLLPRKTLETVGLLDETIFYAPEDVDYCARVWASGLEVWYWPEVSIIHDCQRITRKKPFSRLAASHGWCLIRFWSKYRCWFARSHMRGDRKNHVAHAA